jgi:hypothetical protein
MLLKLSFQALLSSLIKPIICKDCDRVLYDRETRRHFKFLVFIFFWFAFCYGTTLAVWLLFLACVVRKTVLFKVQCTFCRATV